MSKRSGRGQRGGRPKRQAPSRAAQLYDPSTPPERAAELLLEEFGDKPVPPVIAPGIIARGGPDHARAVATAALAQGIAPGSLSLAADVAILTRHPAEALAHSERALEIMDEPPFQVRRAVALAALGRVPEAVDYLNALLAENPYSLLLQSARADLLEALQSSGSLTDDGQRVLAQFDDDHELREIESAIAAFADSGTELGARIDEGLAQWTAAGAVSIEDLRSWADDAGPEVLRELALVSEWCWMAPLPDHEETLVEAFAEAPETAPGLRERARRYAEQTEWGLWEVERIEDGPGVWMTDLLSGLRLHAQVPAQLLDEMPRWSVLLGPLSAVDGVWRAGFGFWPASPEQGREMAHSVLDAALNVEDSAPEDDEEARELAEAFGEWAGEAHERFDMLWLPETAEPPPDGYEYFMRALTPRLVATLRDLEAAEDEEIFEARLEVVNGKAAWRALSTLPDFIAADDDRLYWLNELDEDDDDLDDDEEVLDDDWDEEEEDEDGEEDWGPDEDEEDIDARGIVTAERRALVVQLSAREHLPELLRLLAEAGHGASVERERTFRRGDEEALVVVPEGLTPETARPWLRAWPEQALPALDGKAPVDLDESEREVLVRHLEYELDRQGLSEADTGPVREALGIA